MKKQAKLNTTTGCKIRITAIGDAMEILSGKWKFHILGTLLQSEKMGFMDLMREVDGIGAINRAEGTNQETVPLVRKKFAFEN